MATTKGFFSIIQFCPDLDRGECANVGVVLVAPSLAFVGVRLSDDNEGPKQRFGKDAFDDVRLTLAKKAIEGRLKHEAPRWSGPEDLVKFGQKEGNHLLVTQPRVILLENAAAELEELFERLAHVEAKQRRRSIKPDLKELFESKLSGVPLRRDVPVSIPELGEFEVPYAYKNGRLNLIRPEGFPLDEGAVTTKANELAVKGHLIYKHPDELGEDRKLIVVGGFDASTPESLKNRVKFLLEEHEARLVRADEIDAFVEEVRRDAHN